MYRPFGVCLVALAVLSTACGPKDAGKSDSTKVAQTGTPSLASFDPVTHVVVVHAKDFAFDAPDTITAGQTSFHFVNDGPNLHHLQIIRLDSAKTLADFQTAMKTPGATPGWVIFTGGPNAPNPGSASDEIAILQPGDYVLICLVDIPDKTPHFMKGMIRPLKVVRNPGQKLPDPVADIAMILSDYSFAIKGPLTAGKHTIQVANAGPQPHEVQLVRLLPGKTLKDLAAFDAKPDGPPPGDALGGVAAEAPGMTGYFSVDFTPGTYVLLCFVPDDKDGKTHIDHGMIKEFTIK